MMLHINLLVPSLIKSTAVFLFPAFSYHKDSNNKLMVHMYIVKNTTIFLIVRLLIIRYNYMFRPSMLVIFRLYIFRLYMKHLTIS